MAGLYSILKTWNENETLASDDLNAEFLNNKTNFVAAMAEGYSTVNNVANLSRIQSTIDPAPGGDPLASTGNSSIAGEIQKLRYAIKRLLETSNWYDAPQYLTRYINRRPYFWAGGDGAIEWIDNGGRGGGVSSGGVSVPTFGTDDGKFVNGYLNCTSTQPSFHIGKLNEKKITIGFYLKGFQTNGTIMAHSSLDLTLKTNASNFLVLNLKTMEDNSATAKKSFTITSTAAIDPGAWTHVMFTIDFSGASGTHFMRLFVDGVETGTAISSETFYIQTPIAGDMLISTEISRAEDLTSKLAFDSLTLSGFTYSGSGNTLANGIISIAGGATNYYTQDITPQTIEFMGKLDVFAGPNAGASGTYIRGASIITIGDSSNREIHLRFDEFGITITANAISTSSEGIRSRIQVDTTEWHNYRFYGTLASGMALYIDGRFVIELRTATPAMTALTATGGSTGSSIGAKFRFGCQDEDGKYGFSFANMAYDTSQVALWEASGYTGKMCEIFAIADSLPTTQIFPNQFLTRQVKTLFGDPLLPNPIFVYGGSGESSQTIHILSTQLAMNYAGFQSPPFFLSSKRRARFYFRLLASKSSNAGTLWYGLTLGLVGVGSPAGRPIGYGGQGQVTLAAGDDYAVQMEQTCLYNPRVGSDDSADVVYYAILTPYLGVSNANGAATGGRYMGYSVAYVDG